MTPVQAGRLGLWLLGKRSHNKALRRTVSAKHVPTGGVVDKLQALVAPWQVYEYPGFRKILGAWTGVSWKTAKEWLYGKRALPRKHAATLAAIAEQRAAEFAALAAELRAIADAPDQASSKARSRMRKRVGERDV